MNRIAFIRIIQALTLVFMCSNVMAGSFVYDTDPDSLSLNSYQRLNTPPVANNDTFIYANDCDNVITGNILANDFDPDGDEILLYFAVTPEAESFSITPNGDFILELPENFKGEINFPYYITEQTNSEFKDLASVCIKVLPDCDCDHVSDDVDLDNDNDGITDEDEGNGLIDSDNDQIADCYDIDSDNDGITDNIEWQSEFFYVAPLNQDANHNGLDDAYDTLSGGVYYSPEDTNNDGIPDMLDPDSDNDGIDDIIEAFDTNLDGKSEMLQSFSDQDGDGLDDAFDNVNSWAQANNTTGSTSPLPDSDGNGIRDWRDFSLKENNLTHFIYPNPVKDKFKIIHSQIRMNTKLLLEVYTIKGILILREDIFNPLNSIDVSDLKNGIYLVNVCTEDFSGSQKLFISK
uniref:T9SS type A sorting domain-containing protein n=1 Tax=uncultured Draconibacterium sp. TaxID=1573823 RepID=UPI003216F328